MVSDKKRMRDRFKCAKNFVFSESTKYLFDKRINSSLLRKLLMRLHFMKMHLKEETEPSETLVKRNKARRGPLIIVTVHSLEFIISTS